MGTEQPETKHPLAREPSPLRLVAMAVTPWALRPPFPLTRGMNAAERLAAKRANQRFVQRHMGTYLDRGGRILVALIGLYLFGIWGLGSPWIAAVAALCLAANLTHLLCIAFWKQHLDDVIGRDRGAGG